MPDHDELLPSEQVYPAFVQELRTIYQMKPEEKQVLTRVHERLAQSSHPLPLPEPIRAGVHTRPLRPVSTVSSPSRFRQRWSGRLNNLVAVFFVGLLVGSLALTFSIINHTSVGSPPVNRGSPPVNAIRVLLVPAKNGSTPSHAEMEVARTILSQRFSNFGLHGSSVSVTTTNGQPAILVELPRSGGNKQQPIPTLLDTGVLAFWDTGPGNVLAPGTSFHPAQHTRYNPGGKPRFTNRDLDPSALSTAQDPQTREIVINGMMKGNAIMRFQLYTANNIGHALTITLDGKVLVSAIIESSIAGPFIISLPSTWTQQQASAIVSVLKYGPLPVELKKLA